MYGGLHFGVAAGAFVLPVTRGVGDGVATGEAERTEGGDAIGSGTGSIDPTGSTDEAASGGVLAEVTELEIVLTEVVLFARRNTTAGTAIANTAIATTMSATIGPLFPRTRVFGASGENDEDGTYAGKERGAGVSAPSGRDPDPEDGGIAGSTMGGSCGRDGGVAASDCTAEGESRSGRLASSTASTLAARLASASAAIP